MQRIGTLTLGCSVAVLALFAAGCGASRIGSAHENRIESAFVRLLEEDHPGFSGASRCPSEQAAQQAEPQRCVAEIHRGKEYVQVWVQPTLQDDKVRLKDLATESWTRRWSKVSRPPQHISPGLISVNGTGSYDWRWLLLGVDYACRQKHQASCTADAHEGQWSGYPLFFTFHCNVEGPLITCRNKLGDAVRWRPDAR